MSNSDTITVNGKTYNTLEGGTCKHRNVIYLVQCTLCTKGYVGKTRVGKNPDFSRKVQSGGQNPD